MAAEQKLLESALEHHKSGRWQQAADDYQRVLQADPNNADGLYLFGCLAQQTGNVGAARDLLQSALALAPGQAEYRYALGLAFAGLEDFRAAAQSYRDAIQLAPQHAAAHAGLGDALLSLSQPSEAISAFQAAIHADPEMARAWYGQGCAENARKEFVAARDCFQTAVDLQPEWLEARHNLGRALYELGNVSEAFVAFQHCSEMDQGASAQSRAMLAVIAPGVAELDNAAILSIRKNWAERDLRQEAAFERRASSVRPRRIGYVSSFFQRDNWMKPVWGLINQHDRQAMQVHLFSDCARTEIRHGYRQAPEDRYFDSSGLSNDGLSDLIRACGIDVLVDLNGYSNMRRLAMFSKALAPVVVGWFNMYATSGMAGFDYLIGDQVVVPTEEEKHYSEGVLRVPGSYLSFEVSYPAPPVSVRSGGPRGLVFGSFASLYKITDGVIEVWSRILRESAQSCLLLKNAGLRSSAARAELLLQFRQHGIEADRVQLEGPEAHFEFLSAYDRIDLALDPFPYNGGTTTTEAIWQGVPVVTFYGDRWASRTSASILRAGGLEEFVAEDLKGYVALAAALANDQNTLERLQSLRREMRQRLQASAVCDTAAFARAMEELYERCCVARDAV